MSNIGDYLPGPEDRPDTPEFWKLCDVLLQQDARVAEDGTSGMERTITEVISLEVLAYVAVQRASRLMTGEPRELSRVTLQASLASMFMDGFVAGARYVPPQQSN